MTELQDLTALIRANTPLIVIETQDEARIVELFRQALSQVWRALYRWSITEGLRRIDMDREDEAQGPPDASAALQAMKQAEQRGIYLLLDFHPYLGYASSQRQLRDLIQRRHCQPHVVVLVGAKVELPPELEAVAVRFNPRLPDANALLKMVREEATDYARENGGRRHRRNLRARHPQLLRLRLSREPLRQERLRPSAFRTASPAFSPSRSFRNTPARSPIGAICRAG